MGFKDKDGKYRPTENNDKKGKVNSKDAKDSKDSKVDKKSAEDIKKLKSDHRERKHNESKEVEPKKSLDEIISDETEKRLDELEDDEDAYDDFLDDVGSMEQLFDDYSYSHIIKETDDVMYRTGLNDYVDSVVRDEEHELKKQAEDEVYNNLEDYGLTEDDYQNDPFFEAVDKKYDELYEERVEELHDDTSSYDDALDESPDPDMGGSYSSILKEVDPTAYRVGKSDWIDGERERVEEEVRDEINEDESLEKGRFEE
jgi:hypothetical protein